MKQNKNQKNTAVNQITEGVIWKQLLIFFFPILFGTLFQQIYNTADTVVVGRFVGKEALAAVGGSSSMIVNLIVGFFVGLCSGASVVISQFYGAKDHKNLKKALHTSMIFCLAASIIVGTAGFILAEPILHLMKTPAEVIPDSVLYLHIYFAGTFFNLVYNMVSSILRAVGDSKTALCADHYLFVEYFAGCCICSDLPYGSPRCCTCNSQLPGSQCHPCNLVPDARRGYLSSGIS